MNQAGAVRFASRLPLLVSGGLVLLLGGLGLLAGARFGELAQGSHRNDRVVLQRTLASLTSEYSQIAAGSLLAGLATQKSEGDAAWPATDRLEAVARLRRLTAPPSLFDGGAVLVGPLGTPLASDLQGTPPSLTDAGWEPLRRTVLARTGALPVSGVLRADGDPLLAVALPVPLDDGTLGLVVGTWRARPGTLQRYTSGLHYGRTGRGWIIDGAGRVVAAPRPELVGGPLPMTPVLRAVQAAASRHSSGIVQADGWIASYAAAGTSGWRTLTIQRSSEFLGPLVTAGRLTEAAVLGLLLISGGGLIVLQRRRQSALRRAATHDELTGVLNRRGWFEQAELELARAARAREERVLVFVDVDGLKQVNDVLGHREGDNAIRDAAAVLRAATRRTDHIGRLGGDEFVVLLGAGGSVPSANRRILEALAARNADSSVGYDLLLSLGAEVWSPTDPCGVDELVRRADAIMYVEKQSRPQRHEQVLRPPNECTPTGASVPHQQGDPVGQAREG